jgi:oligosaccharide repeat unit polymerase
MVTILAITCLTLFAGVALYIERSAVYPPFAMAACWAAFLTFHACSRSVLFPIHEETVLFFVAGALSFWFGGLCVHFFYRPESSTGQYDSTRVKKILNVLLLILGVAFPFYVRFIFDLVGDVANGMWWFVLKERLIEEHTRALSGFSVMDNLVVLADIVVIIAWYHRDTEKWRAWAAFGFFILYTLPTAARAGFVFVLLSLFTIEALRRRRIPWRALIALGLVFALAFFGLAILIGSSGASADQTLAENAPSLAMVFQLYAVGSLVAFDNLYRHPSAIAPTQDIDRNFKIIANKLGFRTEIPDLNAEFSTVGTYGLDTNAYTIYFSYFPQLGTLGSLAMMLLLGAVVTAAYFKAISGGPQAVIMFAILFYGIPLSGYSENYFMNLNFLAKMLLFTFLFYGVRSRRSPILIPC